MATRDCYLVGGGRGFRGRPSMHACVGGAAAGRWVLHIVVVGEDYESLGSLHSSRNCSKQAHVSPTMVMSVRGGSCVCA